ncbi:MAG: hypothetical protein KGJ84_07485 [Elusimicrobia bacterium]|nr:hypothetical protein [Elusimicrobiota bacterium]
MAAYHFSWVFFLIPLLFRGNSFPNDYLFLFCLLAAGNVAHQTLTLPLVFVDREMYLRQKAMFLVGPVLVLAATGVALVLSVVRVPWFFAFIGASVLISSIWNFWHVYMQKYGILRLYNAKSPSPVKVPGWSDRLFVFSWLPLYFAVLGPRHRDLLLRMFPLMRGALAPLIAALTAAAPVLVPASVLVVALSFASFVWHERRSSSWSAPRWSMALGMAGLSACILVFDPIKAVMAFSFSHLLEYFVFVWAFERRKGVARAGPKILGFAALAVGAFLFAVGWGRLFFPGARFPVAFGVPFDRIGTVFVIFQSLFHFHADGRLWKVGRPEVRRSL